MEADFQLPQFHRLEGRFDPLLQTEIPIDIQRIRKIAFFEALELYQLLERDGETEDFGSDCRSRGPGAHSEREESRDISHVGDRNRRKKLGEDGRRRDRRLRIGDESQVDFRGPAAHPLIASARPWRRRLRLGHGKCDLAFDALNDLGDRDAVLLQRRNGCAARGQQRRSEEHTSELQSPYDIVCRLLLEKKKKHKKYYLTIKNKKNKKKK